MKIVQITPGIMPIPPNGWGAIESIVWSYKINFDKLGYICDIKYLDEVDNEKYDIIHIHVANLAILAKQRNLKYIFSVHDHHIEIHEGTKNIMKEAIDGAEIAFVHAEHLLDFFDNPPNLFYIPHGVNTDIYKPIKKNSLTHSLLCVGNNGLDSNHTIDRKGFLVAIQVAQKLNLPLTIAGPTNCNKKFFEYYSDSINYDKLNIIYDLSEKELIELYQNHTIFLHPSNLEAGHPNLTLLEATACGLPIVGTFKGSNIIQSMYVTDRNVDLIIQGVKFVINNYNYLNNLTKECITTFSWLNITKELEKHYLKIYRKTENSFTMKDSLLNLYDNLIKNNKEYTDEIIVSYMDGCSVTVRGLLDKKYNVKFIDKDENVVVHEGDIKSGMWIAPSKKYFTNWEIKVDDKKFDTFNLKDKKVLITFNSSAFGDNIAWIPFVEEFRKKHKCFVTVTTFHNYLFEDCYPEIEFLEPGVSLSPYYVWYQIGVFDKEGVDDLFRNKNPWREIPLQKTITDILGLEYKEIQSKINIPKDKPIIDGKYVVITPHSTLKAKLWNNPNGWEKITKYLKKLGYKVISVSIEPANIKGTIDFSGRKINDVINVIYNSEFLIGLGSGLSWAAWALNKPVIMISGFSKKYSEFDCYRIEAPKGKCNGCYNDISVPFSRGDWNWCPFKKNFECSTSIEPIMVEKVIDQLIQENNLK